MKKFSIRTYIPLVITGIIMVMPLITLAATNAPAAGFVNAPDTGYVNQPAPATCTGNNCKLGNPLKVTNFCDLIKTVLQAILIIGMPIAVVFLVIVGFKFILAQGNPEKISEAQKNFLHTVIGIAIFLGAWTIAKIIASTLQGLGVSAVNECTR